MKAYPQERLEVSLPEGFTVRGARLEDVEPALKLFNSWSQSVIQEDEITDAQAIRNEWVSPGFDPNEDICLVFAPDGEMVGYIEVWTIAKPPVHPWIWARVHPDYEGLGIGTWMLQWGEERAMRALKNIPDGLRFAPRVGIYSKAEKSKKLFEELGYSYIRSSYRMVIDMDGLVPEPVWPEGITLRTYNLRQMLRRFIARIWNRSATTLDLWKNHLKKASNDSNISNSNLKASTQLYCS